MGTSVAFAAGARYQMSLLVLSVVDGPRSYSVAAIGLYFSLRLPNVSRAALYSPNLWITPKIPAGVSAQEEDTSSW